MKLFKCKHRIQHLTCVRAHRESVLALKHFENVISIDQFGCCLFIKCNKCGEILSISSPERYIYGLGQTNKQKDKERE